MKKCLLLGVSAALALSACGESDFATASPVDLRRDLVYVSDATGVHAFDAATLAPAGLVLAQQGLGEIHATPDGALVWTLSREEGRVYMFDTRQSERSFAAVGVSPVHSYLSSDRETIWVGNDGSSSVTVIDVATRSALETVLTGDGHHKMAIVPGPTGALETVYVSNISGSITPVTAEGVALANVPGVGPAPHGIDYAAATKEVYSCTGDIDAALEGEQPGIEIIATDTNTVVDHIALPEGRCGYLHVEEDGFAYFTNGAAGLLGRVRLLEREVTLYELGGRPDKFALVGDQVVVADALGPRVFVVSLVDGAVRSVATGAPVDPAAPPASAHRDLRQYGDRVYVPSAFDGSVTVLDAETFGRVGTITGLTSPTGVALAGPSGGSTYPR